MAASTGPVLKKLIFVGKTRNIDTEENQLVAKEIHAAVDEMEKYRCVYGYCASLRSIICSKTGISKARAGEVLSSVHKYDVQTSIGGLSYYRTISMSERTEILKMALKEMDIDIDVSISEMSRKKRYILDIDTKALSWLVNDQKFVMNKVFFDSVKLIQCDSDNEHDKFLSGAINWIKESARDRKAYLTAYNTAKQIFSIASTNGTFPRLYIYKGVIFKWKDMIEIGSFSTQTMAYLRTAPEKLIHVKAIMERIRKEKNETRYMFALDGYEYDNEGEQMDDEAGES